MAKRIILLPVLLVLLTTVVLAEGGEGHFNWFQFLGKSFNSIVLFGGLIYILRKPLIELLARKSEEVKTDIIQREEHVVSTTRELASIRERLQKIEAEVRDIKLLAEQSGKDEKHRLEEAGNAEALRLKAITEDDINTKVDLAVRRLKEKIADLTIEHFKKDIQSHLDPKTHERIMERNIDISGDIIERK